MKTRDQIYAMEAASILRDITTYHCILHSQLLRLYPGKEQKIENLLNWLTRQQRIRFDPQSGLYHDGSGDLPDREMLAAIWILTDFIEKVEYHSACDFPAKLLFFAEGKTYEVLYAAAGKEPLYEQAVSCSADMAGKYLVIVEELEQIERLRIPNAVYCTVDVQTGRIRYFRQEE